MTRDEQALVIQWIKIALRDSQLTNRQKITKIKNGLKDGGLAVAKRANWWTK